MAAFSAPDVGRARQAPMPIRGIHRTQGVSMRFPFRLTLGARTLALIAFALLLVGLGGACENNHVGRTCDLGVESDGTETTITSPALECPSRICILPQAERPAAGTLPLCTATCSSDGDCGGEQQTRAIRTITAAGPDSPANGRRPLAPSVARRCAFAATSCRDRRRKVAGRSRPSARIRAAAASTSASERLRSARGCVVRRVATTSGLAFSAKSTAPAVIATRWTRH